MKITIVCVIALSALVNTAPIALPRQISARLSSQGHDSPGLLPTLSAAADAHQALDLGHDQAPAQRRDTGDIDTEEEKHCRHKDHDQLSARDSEEDDNKCKHKHRKQSIQSDVVKKDTDDVTAPEEHHCNRKSHQGIAERDDSDEEAKKCNHRHQKEPSSVGERDTTLLDADDEHRCRHKAHKDVAERDTEEGEKRCHARHKDV